MVFSVRYELNSVLACCNLHRYSVLVEVKAFGSIGKQPYTVTTIVCGDCCNYRVSSKKGRWNMGFLKKIKFWKKRNNNTPTKVDACVSTDDPRTCDAARVSIYQTVMCFAYTQTETRMDGGGGAAKVECESELAMKNRKIRELEEELAVSKRLTVDLMLNTNSVEQQVRKYAEETFALWSDDCECKQLVTGVADVLKKFFITERNANNTKPEATSGRNTKFDCETQTEANSTQRDCANADEQESVRRLEDKDGELSVLVEEYERKTVLLNEEMEHMFRDRTSHIHRIKQRYEEENRALLCKIRDMRDEIISLKESRTPPTETPRTTNRTKEVTARAREWPEDVVPASSRQTNPTALMNETSAERETCHPACKTETCHPACKIETCHPACKIKTFHPACNKPHSGTEGDNFVLPDIHGESCRIQKRIGAKC
jgi:hypothetical protein